MNEGVAALAAAPRPDTGAASTNPPRLDGIDALRGAAIVGVVLIHAAPANAPLWNEFVVSGAARLAVPAFLLVSGFLHASRGTSRTRMIEHAVTFVRLHLLWAVAYLLVDLVDPRSGFDVSGRSLLLHFGAGAWPGQFFLVVMVQVMLVAAAIGGSRRWASSGVLVAALAAWAAGTALLLVWQGGSDLPALLEGIARARGNPVWLWFAYFTMGGLAGLAARPLGRPPVGAIAGAAAMLVGGAVVAGLGLPPTGSETYVAAFPYPRVSVLLGTMLVALALPTIAVTRGVRPLVALGRSSFAIYVLNPALLLAIGLLAGPPRTIPTSLVYVGLTLTIGWVLSEILRRRAPFLLP